MYWRLNERAAGHRSRAPPALSSWPARQPYALLRRQLALLAAAVFIVAAGYGRLMPVFPAWLARYMPQAGAAGVARHVGFLSGAYAAGVLVGALVWGFLSDRVGRGRILILGMGGFVVSLPFLIPWAILYLLNPGLRAAMWRVSLVTALFGLTEPLFVPAYWNPPSLFELAQRTGFDIESLIFAFAIGGVELCCTTR